LANPLRLLGKYAARSWDRQGAGYAADHCFSVTFTPEYIRPMNTLIATAPKKESPLL